MNSGAKSTDRIDGTLLIDQARSTRYWADTFCGICTPEARDNQEVFAKGTYFLSTRGTGTHTMVFGYDNFDDIRNANNHQSGKRFPHPRHDLLHRRGRRHSEIPRRQFDDHSIQPDSVAEPWLKLQDPFAVLQ